MKNPHDVVKGLLRTEKATVIQPDRKYLFWVAGSSNKIEIKRSIEDIYKVKVDSVNTMNVTGKERRVRYAVGKTPDWKKAVVTLKEGSKIDIV